jgi:hypothetical protein
MTRKAGNSLQAMLDRAAAAKAAPVEAEVPAVEAGAGVKRGRGRPTLASQGREPAPRKPPSTDTQLVGGQLPRALAKQLRQLAADEDTTVVALLEEAITDLLVKKAARTLRR